MNFQESTSILSGHTKKKSLETYHMHLVYIYIYIYIYIYKGYTVDKVNCFGKMKIIFFDFFL